ncbi:unnamed protein product [Cuscuta europaea]|uniref:DDE Tnp4 domain-containing protein n=1 Tax=Cuscuta europaea TaxID=41803 RepID=A0A9P0ZA61_CUSEU|nr:unnamed protein product [Cuscuta europaea]
MNVEVRQSCLIIALEELRSLLEDDEQKKTRIPMRVGGETGGEYIHRMLNGHPGLCKEQLRLTREMFIHVAEQIGIGLYILAKGASYTDAADVFKHSLRTICKYFNLVLHALVELSFDIIQPHHNLLDVHTIVFNSSFYWPYFKDSVGALDGTHIEAVISDAKGVPFRGRKGVKTWNVLACCSFDKLFTFVNIGWEGSAHDVRVWVDSLMQSKYHFLHPPPGKYYLVDSGYPNTLGYLAPFDDAGMRKRVLEFRDGGKPRGVMEHFNYRHSSLRTTIERAFSHVKKRWKIFHNMPKMKEEHQQAIIFSTFTLHNFISMCKMGMPIYEHDGNGEGMVDSDMFNNGRKEAMNNVRVEIVKQIWEDVQKPRATDA